MSRVSAFFALILSILLYLPASGALKKLQPKNVNLRSSMEEYNAFLANRPKSANEAKGSGVKPFRRLEWYLESRLEPDGTLPAGGRWNAYVEELSRKSSSTATPFSANWTSLGPNNMAGRMLSFAFDRNNSGVVWAGAADGGLWKSTNGGSLWTAANDRLPTLSIGCVVTDPLNSNIVYIGTGEGSFNIDAVQGVGVLKTTDGGATWAQTGLSWLLSQGESVNQMVIHPTNSSVLVAATRLGMYRTQDGGSTWTHTLAPASGWMDAKDVVMDPSNPNTLYAAAGFPWGDNNNGVYKSTDNGATWTKLTVGLPPGLSLGRISLGISATNPGTVYAGIANTIGNGSALLGIYRTTDGGATWTLQSSTPNHYNGQGWYNNAIAVDPANANIVYSGGTNLYKSSDGGATWSTITNGIHVDFHVITFNGGTMYVGCDGGAYKSTTGGSSWTSLNNGLVTMQFYKMGSDRNNGSRAMGGTQDNGSNEFTGTTSWSYRLGGDGAEVTYDYSNSNVIYGEYQNGSHQKSTNGGSSWTSINSGLPSGPWVTPVEMDPVNPGVLYTIGSNNLYGTTNGGSSWSLLLDAVDDLTRDIRVAPSDNHVVYVCGTNSIYRSTNSGTSFTKISTGLAASNITAMAVHPSQPQTLYVTNGGWSSTSHVFKTTDAGTTWQNITTGVPNVPCNTVVLDPDYPATVYVGTDLGVYASVDGGTSWTNWNDGLPNVVVDELDIQRSARVIRAATHGRGMFQSSLLNSAPAVPSAPGSLVATAASVSQINLSWADNSSDESGFKVERKTGLSGTYAEIGTVGANTVSYSDAGLSASTQYYYRVRAYSASGNSSYSNEANATTLANPLNAPGNLVATATSMSQIDLAWADSSANENGFKIERKIGSGGTYAEIATVGANVVAYSNTGLASSTTYYYRIRAYNTSGTSGYSNEANATTQTNPNLALNKPATASSTSSPYFPAKALDGNLTTYWRSGSVSKTKPVWWTVDLLSPVSVGRVVMRWQGTSFARIYHVQVSLDTVNFTSVYKDSLGTGGVDDASFMSTTARYVRIYMFKNNGGNERLLEVEVYASPAAHYAGTSPVDPGVRKDVPAEVSLAQNYPDPFNPSTVISYTLPEGRHIRLRVMNTLGQEVATLADGFYSAGTHQVTFDGSQFSSGIYFSVLEAGVATRVRRMLLIK